MAAGFLERCFRCRRVNEGMEMEEEKETYFCRDVGGESFPWQEVAHLATSPSHNLRRRERLTDEGA